MNQKTIANTLAITVHGLPSVGMTLATSHWSWQSWFWSSEHFDIVKLSGLGMLLAQVALLTTWAGWGQAGLITRVLTSIVWSLLAALVFFLFVFREAPESMSLLISVVLLLWASGALFFTITRLLPITQWSIHLVDGDAPRPATGLRDLILLQAAAMVCLSLMIRLGEWRFAGIAEHYNWGLIVFYTMMLLPMLAAAILGRNVIISCVASLLLIVGLITGWTVVYISGHGVPILTVLSAAMASYVGTLVILRAGGYVCVPSQLAKSGTKAATSGKLPGAFLHGGGALLVAAGVFSCCTLNRIFEQQQVYRYATVVLQGADNQSVAIELQRYHDTAWLSGIAAFPNVQRLSFAHYLLSDEHLAALPHLPQLRVLEIRDTQITGEGFRWIQPLPMLDTIDAASSRLNDESLRYFERFPRLYTIDLSDCPITDNGMNYLSRLANLQKLFIYGSHVTDVGVRELFSGRLSELRIGGEGTSVTAGTVLEFVSKRYENMGQLPDVSYFNLTERITISGDFISLQNVRAQDQQWLDCISDGAFTTLYLSGSGIDSRTTPTIARHMSISKLGLINTRLDSADLQDLEVLANLVSLDLSYSALIDDGALGSLQRLPKLRHLNASESGLSFAAAIDLFRFWINQREPHEPHEYTVSGTGYRFHSELNGDAETRTFVTIDDRHASSLSLLANLYVVDMTLSGRSFTDEELSHLKHFQQLRKVTLHNTTASASVLRSLRQSRPDLQIARFDEP